jgi:hypothetical protein
MRKQKLPAPDALDLSRTGTATRWRNLLKASAVALVLAPTMLFALSALVQWWKEGHNDTAWNRVTAGAFVPELIAAGIVLLAIVVGQAIRAYAQVHAAHRTRAEDAEEREAALIAERDQASVTVPHEEHLKALLETFGINIANHDICDYSAPMVGDQDNRDAIVAHFGALADSLDAWDRAIARSANATPALRQWIETRAGELRIPEKTLVADRLFPHINRAARDGKLAAPLLTLKLERGLVGDGPDGAVALGKVNLLLVTAEPADDIEERFTAAGTLLQDLFTEAQESAEAAEIAAAEIALVYDAVPLHQNIRRHKMHTPVSQRVPECPFCRVHREAGAVPIGAHDSPVIPT